MGDDWDKLYKGTAQVCLVATVGIIRLSDADRREVLQKTDDLGIG